MIYYFLSFGKRGGRNVVGKNPFQILKGSHYQNVIHTLAWSHQITPFLSCIFPYIIQKLIIPVNTNYSKTEYQPFPHFSLQNFASITIQNNLTITVCREKSGLLNWCKMYKVSTVPSATRWEILLSVINLPNFSL